MQPCVKTSSPTFCRLWEHARQTLDAHLELYVPDAQNFVLGEANELTTWLVELDQDDSCHVSPQHLHTTPVLEGS